MELGLIKQIPVDVQRDVLAFDWWIKNCDRLQGNTNLLVDAATRELVVIDHNLAFDRNFLPDEFITQHVFASHWAAIRSDLVLQAQYAQRMVEALSGLDLACDNAPEEWRWLNIEMDVPASFDLEQVKQTLDRCTTPELWSTV